MNGTLRMLPWWRRPRYPLVPLWRISDGGWLFRWLGIYAWSTERRNIVALQIGVYAGKLPMRSAFHIIFNAPFVLVGLSVPLPLSWVGRRLVDE